MSTDNNKRRATVWHRLLAGTLVGFALVLMVVAGVYTRARNANAAAKYPAVQETSVGSMVESADPTSPADGKAPKAKKIKVPPPPPAPDGPAPVSAPAPPQPPQSPLGPATAPPAPPAPTAPAPSTPASPAVAPTAPTKEKSKSKDKDKNKDDKNKVEKGKLIEAPQPVYPPEARDQKVEGEVSVVITIGDEGNVISAKPTSGPELLQAAARDAAFKARFKPTLLNGNPVKVSGIISYSFVLDKK